MDRAVLIAHYDKPLDWAKVKGQRWVYTTNEADWFIGRFFEYTWHYIFTRNPIEQDLNYMI